MQAFTVITHRGLADSVNNRATSGDGFDDVHMKLIMLALIARNVITLHFTPPDISGTQYRERFSIAKIRFKIQPIQLAWLRQPFCR